MYSSQVGIAPKNFCDATLRGCLVGPFGPDVALLEERPLRAVDDDAVLVDDGRLGRHEQCAAAAGLDLAHRLAVVRLATEEQDRSCRGSAPPRHGTGGARLPRAAAPASPRRPSASGRTANRRGTSCSRPSYAMPFCASRSQTMSGSRRDGSARSARRPADSRGSPCRERRTPTGSAPWTSMRTRAGPATNSCDSCRAVAVVMRRSPRLHSPRRPASEARISTDAVVPSTRIRSPVAMRFVAIDVPMTAGIPNSRDSTAGCEVVPPVSVTRPAILVNSTTQAGLVIWQTRMSPSRTSSNSSTVWTTRPIPSTVPGEPAMPLITGVASSDCWRWKRSG